VLSRRCLSGLLDDQYAVPETSSPFAVKQDPEAVHDTGKA
jgi:hypothetical protein